MNTNCKVTSIDPKGLKEKQFIEIHEVAQDLWAHGIGEFVQCKCCGKMMSKQDIFGHLAKDVYDETTKKIMELLEISEISCIECSGKTEFMYGEGYIDNIRERLLNHDSHIVVAQDHNGKIVGYMDGYTDSVEGVFNREYYTHYKEIGVGEISSRVKNILGYSPKQILGYSGVGLTQKYSNFFNIFSLMREFYKTVTLPPETPAITEIDRNNSFGNIFNSMGFKSLEIQNSPDLAGKITNVGKNYDSELIVFKRPIAEYRERFGEIGIKGFLKMFPSCIPKRERVEA